MSSPAPRLEPVPPGGSLARQFATILLLVVTLAVSLTFLFVQLPQTTTTSHSTLVLVWSGMRPDMVSSTLTPNLDALGNQGVVALDHHAAYPTTTLVNAAVMSTGDNPGGTKAGASDGSGQVMTTGASAAQDTGVPDDMPFWLLPGSATTATPTAGATSTVTATPRATATATTSHATPTATARAGATVTPNGTATPPSTPTATATAVPDGVADLTQDQTQIALQQALPGGLVRVPSVAQEALSKGMNVSYEGANGVALLQSLDAVTKSRSQAYVIDDQMTYPASLTQQMIIAGVTPPSQLPGTAAQHAPDMANDDAFTQAFLKVLLPTFKTANAPFFSVITYADPAATAALTGVGSAEQVAAIQADDRDLGAIIDGLRQDNLLDSTNIIVTSDHGMDDVIQPGNSSAAGQSSATAAADQRTDMTTLMTAAAAQGAQGPLPDITPASVSTGAVTDATLVVLVANGGMDTISFPTTPALTTLGNGDVARGRALLAQEIVPWLQQVKQVGPIFVADSLSAHIDGVLPLSTLMLASDRAPAIEFSFTTHALDVGDRATNLQQLGGSTYADAATLATAGTLSRRDLHTIFYAQGPGFKQSVRDTAPTGAIDIAPTVENLLGLTVPTSQQGRSLDELLINGTDAVSTGSKDPAVSTEAHVISNNTFFLEVVEFETVNGVTYIQDAYAIHSTTPQPPDDLKKQALALAAQE